MLKLHCIA